MLSALDRLAEQPGLGRELEYELISYRRWRSGRHVVVYRVNKDALVVIRVLHNQSDILAQIEE